MKRLSYWVAQRIDDSRAYSLRGARRKDVVAQLAEQGLGPKGGCTPWGATWGPVTRVTVEYADLLDLVEQCLGEGGGGWEDTD